MVIPLRALLILIEMCQICNPEYLVDILQVLRLKFRKLRILDILNFHPICELSCMGKTTNIPIWCSRKDASTKHVGSFKLHLAFCKCDSTSVDSFTLKSFELYTSNILHPSLTLNHLLNPLHHHVSALCIPAAHIHLKVRKRSLAGTAIHCPATVIGYYRAEETTTAALENSISLKSTNLRLLSVKCCGLQTNISEFNAALGYIKPDLVRVETVGNLTRP